MRSDDSNRSCYTANLRGITEIWMEFRAAERRVCCLILVRSRTREAFIVSNPLVELVRRYESNPLLRGLVQLVPGASALETTILNTVAQIEADRLRTFFDELGAGRVPLNDRMIETEDFLHAFFATSNAARRTRQREKIRYLARLLRSTFGRPTPPIIDEYEELLSIVEELSFRELHILSLLDQAEEQTSFSGKEDDLGRANLLWPHFEASVEAKLQISPEELAPVLMRLQRSGCYVEITGGYWDYTGGRGHLTRLYRRLVEAAGKFGVVAT